MAIRILAPALTSLLMLAAPASATFRGHNGKIAYYTQVSGIEIYSMNPDGSEKVNLSRHPDEDFAPEWSPDGSKLAFLTERDGTVSNKTEIYTMNADGSLQRRLTLNPAREANPSWSPDGTQIAFDRDGDISVAGVNGFSDFVLLGGPAHDVDPAWSPDGSKLAFTSTRDGNAEVYVMDANGTNLVNLTNHPANDIDPEWSPDGTRIAFDTLRNAGCCGSNFDIYVMNADGSDQHGLITGLTDDIDSTWSPDGAKIAFNRRAPHGEVYVANADGSNPVNVTNDPFIDSGPDWQSLPNRSPDCSTVAASPSRLSPPNHRLVRVMFSGATDPDGDAVALAVTAVTQDEPTGGSSDAVAGPASDQIRLRAERNGNGDGRVYRVTFEARDGLGGVCTGTASVGVPKGSRPATDSAPPSFDSFG